MEKQTRVFIDGKEKRTMMGSSVTSVRDLMKRLGVKNEVVIIKKNKKIAHPGDAVRKGDVVEFVSVIYGG